MVELSDYTIEKAMAVSPGHLTGEEGMIATRAITLMGTWNETLAEWALRVYPLGQHIVATLEEDKCDARVVSLDDGTRRKSNCMDPGTADAWSFLSKVVVIDEQMYKLDDLEKVSDIQGSRVSSCPRRRGIMPN
jgi:hypothetical protein